MNYQEFMQIAATKSAAQINEVLNGKIVARNCWNEGRNLEEVLSYLSDLGCEDKLNEIGEVAICNASKLWDKWFEEFDNEFEMEIHETSARIYEQMMNDKSGAFDKENALVISSAEEYAEFIAMLQKDIEQRKSKGE